MGDRDPRLDLTAWRVGAIRLQDILRGVNVVRTFSEGQWRGGPGNIPRGRMLSNLPLVPVSFTRWHGRASPP